MTEEFFNAYQTKEMLALFLNELSTLLPLLESDTSHLSKLRALAAVLKFNVLKTALEEVIAHPQPDTTSKLINLLKAIAKETPETVLSFLKKQNDLLLSLISQDAGALPDKSLFQLFRNEIEKQSKEMSTSLLDLEKEGVSSALVYEQLMRSAHSLKGAARILHLDALVELAHAMEDAFLKWKDLGEIPSGGMVDRILQGIDLFATLKRATDDEILHFGKSNQEKIASLIASYKKEDDASLPVTKIEFQAKDTPKNEERLLHVSADTINRLMGFAGEVRVETVWLEPFNSHLLDLKKMQGTFERTLETSRVYLSLEGGDPYISDLVTSLQHQSSSIRGEMESLLSDFDRYIRRQTSLSDKLFSEVLSIRMRPFSDVAHSLGRVLRDLSREQGKIVKLSTRGLTALVDRDILEKLEVPLQHLVQNAIVHGIETPEERLSKGKPAEGSIEINATERGGMLVITITDDGRGVNLDEVKEKAHQQKTLSKEYVEQLTEKEMLDFLFLPGFSTASTVTDLSGRGMGLNIVQSVVAGFGGEVSCKSSLGNYFAVQIQLPLTLSIVRALIIETAGEYFAFPLSRIEKALFIDEKAISLVEGKEYIHVEGVNIGLFSLSHLFGFTSVAELGREIFVLIIRDGGEKFALAVDRFMEEKDIVLHELDPLLGKVPCALSGAFIEDGTPLLVVDIDDIAKLISSSILKGSFNHLEHKKEETVKRTKKRILVVDDSITVREVETRILQNLGYEVQTAVDGMEGWNAVRLSHFDLVITDVDMPRLNGVELTKSIKCDHRLSKLPVMMVSYKDREDDKKLGIESGADFYLTKSSFQDDRFITAVKKLLGEET